MDEKTWKLKSEFYSACEEGNLESLRALLDSGMIALSPFGRSPLHVACSHGHIDIVRELLMRGLDIETVDFIGETPLHTSCSCGHIDIVKELLSRKADIEGGRMKKTPLHKACLHDKHVEIVRVLLDQGADIEARDSLGRTPLYIAMDGCSFHIACLLLSRGASPRALGPDGNTPIHLSYAMSNTEIVNKLLDHGADINARNESGSTPLIKAIFHGQRHGIVAELIKRGASVHIADNNGWLPLHWCISVDLATSLLDAGADVDGTTNDGETALDIACIALNTDVVKLLLSRGASISDVHQLIDRVKRGLEHLTKVQRDVITLIEDHAASLHHVMK